MSTKVWHRMTGYASQQARAGKHDVDLALTSLRIHTHLQRSRVTPLGQSQRNIGEGRWLFPSASEMDGAVRVSGEVIRWGGGVGVEGRSFVCLWWYPEGGPPNISFLQRVSLSRPEMYTCLVCCVGIVSGVMNFDRGRPAK